MYGTDVYGLDGLRQRSLWGLQLGVLSSAGSGDITGHYAYNTNNDLWSVFYRMISRANKAKEALESTDSYQTESVCQAVVW